MNRVFGIGMMIFIIILFNQCKQDDNSGMPVSVNFSVVILNYGILELQYSNQNIIENFDPLSGDYYIEDDTLYVKGKNLFSRPIIKVKSNKIEYIDAKQWSDIEFSNISSFENITVEVNSFCNIDSTISINGGSFTLINKMPSGDTIRINSLNANQINVFADHFSPTECIGKAEEFNIDLRGASAHVLGFNLEAINVNVISRGIGKVEVNAKTNLNARIKSVGSIYYKGNPVIDLEDTGLGRLIDAN